MAGGMTHQEFKTTNLQEETNYTVPLVLMVTLFFVFGIITVLNDILIPHFKNTFQLSYTKAMLINGCFFGAYFIMGIPSSKIIDRIGYKKAIVTGLCIVGIGCLSFYPASKFISYYLFLSSLFVIASGITLLQVAANAYVTVLGPPEKASSRISLCGGLNSTATVIGPLIGAALILNQGLFSQVENTAVKEYNITEKTNMLIAADTTLTPARIEAMVAKVQNSNPEISEELIKAEAVLESTVTYTKENEVYKAALSNAVSIVRQQINTAKADAVPLPYFMLAILVFLVAFIFSRVNLPSIVTSQSKDNPNKSGALAFRHLRLGILAIFLYVGAEVVVGSLLINYIGMKNILGLEEKKAAVYVTLYWGAAALARFIGFAVLQKVKPAYSLVCTSVAAMLLITNSMLTEGWWSLGTMIALGLCHSVMWPIIFSLALDGLGTYKTQASGFLIMGVVGGAVIPMIQGALADTSVGLQHSFLVTFACYAFLVYYGAKGYQIQSPVATVPPDKI